MLSGLINSSRRNIIWFRSRIHHISKPGRQVAAILYLSNIILFWSSFRVLGWNNYYLMKYSVGFNAERDPPVKEEVSSSMNCLFNRSSLKLFDTTKASLSILFIIRYPGHHQASNFVFLFLKTRSFSPIL